MASSDKVFGLQASRPSKLTLLASAFTGHPIGFAALRSQTGRQRVEVCSLLPQRDCCRLSRHSLYSATQTRKAGQASPEFKELGDNANANREQNSVNERSLELSTERVNSFKTSRGGSIAKRKNPIFGDIFSRSPGSLARVVAVRYLAMFFYTSKKIKYCPAKV